MTAKLADTNDRLMYWDRDDDGYMRCTRCNALVSSTLTAMLAHVDSKHAEHDSMTCQCLPCREAHALWLRDDPAVPRESCDDENS